MVDLRRLKSMAIDLDEPLRSLILSEPDSIDPGEYFAKSDLWLKLLRRTDRNE